MTGLDLALCGLAVYRWARLIAVDEITRPARVAVERWSTRPPARARRAASARGLAVPDRDPGWRGRVVYLVGCPYCVGVWATVPVLLLSVHAHGSLGWWAVVAGPAVAGAACLASTLDS